SPHRDPVMPYVHVDCGPLLDWQLVKSSVVSVHELVSGNALLDVYHFTADLHGSRSQGKRNTDLGMLWKLISRPERESRRIEILCQREEIAIASALRVSRVQSNRKRIDKPVIDALLTRRAAMKYDEPCEVHIPGDPETIQPERERGPTGGVVVDPAIPARQGRPDQRDDRNDQQNELRRVRLERNVVRSFRRYVELERILGEEASVRFYVGPELRHVVSL